MSEKEIITNDKTTGKEVEEKYDIILIGTEIEHVNYLGSRTFHLKNILQKYLPEIKIGLYDVLAEDDDRIKLKANNYIFLPWIESIDLNWSNFFITMEGLGKKILYTDDFYWYQEQKERLLSDGFNLENLFDTVALSSREHSGWWNSRTYRYWGAGIYNEFYEKIDIKKILEEKDKDKKILFIDSPWSLEMSQEPYNAMRVFDECIPKLKDKYSNLKIVSQNCDKKWVDENLPERLDFNEMLKHYQAADVYVVSHKETAGLGQFDSRLCGVKNVTTKEFSNHSSLLAGEYTHELWSLEEGNQSFIDAVSKCLEDYDHEEIKQLSLQAFNDEIFFKNMVKDLWEVEYKKES